MTPDVNVLVAASRSDHPHHAGARRWLEHALTEAASGRPFTVLPMVLSGFLRLVTHPRVFVHPTPIERAVAYVDALLDLPGVHLAAHGPEWPRMRALCLDKRLTGSDLSDAWIAATVLQLNEHLVTFDRDFRKLLGRGQWTLLEAADTSSKT